MGTSLYRISLTLNKTRIDDLSTPITIDPIPDYARYAEYVSLGDGTRLGVGWLETEWRWKRFLSAWVTPLRVICPGVSASVYIATPGLTGDFTAYSATMHWPHIPNPLIGEFIEDFVIEFTELVATGGST